VEKDETDVAVKPVISLSLPTVTTATPPANSRIAAPKESESTSAKAFADRTSGGVQHADEVLRSAHQLGIAMLHEAKSDDQTDGNGITMPLGQAKEILRNYGTG
jgi:hypothetical protein